MRIEDHSTAPDRSLPAPSEGRRVVAVDVASPASRYPVPGRAGRESSGGRTCRECGARLAPGEYHAVATVREPGPAGPRTRSARFCGPPCWEAWERRADDRG